MRILLFLIILVTSYSASSEEIRLADNFHNSKKLTIEYIDTTPETRDLVAKLTPPPIQNKPLSITCPHEGGDAKLSWAFTFKQQRNLLVATCQYNVNHRGLGIQGKYYETQVLSLENKNFVRHKDIEQILSGYDGSGEEGGRSFFFYDTEDFSKRKIQSFFKKKEDLILAHQIIIKRLRNYDYEAINNYLTEEKISQLREDQPISKKNIQFYNDLGFALSEAGTYQLALNILIDLEKLSPNRTVLQLNIGDTLWSLNKPNEAKERYVKYRELMKEPDLSKNIPPRVFERTR